MGYWDPQDVTLRVQRNREISRVEIDGAVGGNFKVRCYIREIITMGDGTQSIQDQGYVETTADEAELIPTQATRIQQIRNGLQGLARLLKV